MRSYNHARYTGGARQWRCLPQRVARVQRIRVRVKMRSSEILLLAITAVRRQRVVRFDFGTYALMGPLHWVRPFCFPAATHSS